MSEFTIQNNAIITQREDENGQLVDVVVCKSYGPTPKTTVSQGLHVQPVEHAPFTVTEAPQGTMLKLFLVPKDWADGDEWFMSETSAFYLTTSRSMRGFERRWSSEKPFGDLLLECVGKDDLCKLDPRYAYTIFLRHIENDIMGTLEKNSVHLCCIYDTQADRFVPPTDNEYFVPAGFVAPITVLQSVGLGKEIDEEEPLVFENQETGPEVLDGHPLLVTFFCGDHLISLQYQTVTDHNILAIRTLNNDYFRAWVLGKWLGYSGLMDYETHFGIDSAMRSAYVLGVRTFDNALRTRFRGGFRKIAFNIYTHAGIKDLINNKDKYELGPFLEEGMRRLYDSVKDTRFRHKIVNDFFTDYMQI